MTEEEFLKAVGQLKGPSPEPQIGEIARQTAYFITGQCAVSDMDRKEQLIQNAIDQALAVRDEEWRKRWNREMAILQDKNAASEEIEYLRKELVQWNDLKVALGAKDSTAFFDALYYRDREITRLKQLEAGLGKLGEAFQTGSFRVLATEFDQALAKDKQRIAEMTAMVEEAIAIFDRYLNVPESVALRKRWESFKNQP